MKQVVFPYGKEKIAYDFDERELTAVLESELNRYTPEANPAELIQRAMASPVGGVPLWKMAEGKKNVVVIASDHTRPVPSRLIIPPMLSEIRRGNPEAQITLLIATGCHRDTTKEELCHKFGPELVENENIYVHN